MSRLLAIGAIALSALSALETILGVSSAMIILGEAVKLWDLL